MTPESIVRFTQSMQVGYLVVFAIALPFSLPIWFRVGRVFWMAGGVGVKALAIALVAGPAALSGLVAGLALLGEYEHFQRTFPDAFGTAVFVGVGLAVLLVVAEFVAGAMEKRGS